MQDGDKVQLAIQAGDNITIEQLKTTIPELVEVIEATWERAYKK
jgi:hypothetical protein